MVYRTIVHGAHLYTFFIINPYSGFYRIHGSTFEILFFWEYLLYSAKPCLLFKEGGGPKRLAVMGKVLHEV